MFSPDEHTSRGRLKVSGTFFSVCLHNSLAEKSLSASPSYLPIAWSTSFHYRWCATWTTIC